MGAKIAALKFKSRANCCVAGGADGLSSTDANWTTCFESIARPPPVFSSSGCGNDLLQPLKFLLVAGGYQVHHSVLQD